MRVSLNVLTIRALCARSAYSEQVLDFLGGECQKREQEAYSVSNDESYENLPTIANSCHRVKRSHPDKPLVYRKPEQEREN